MGPYCKFCNRRCFVFVPDYTPAHISVLYRGRIQIIATCWGGQKFEKERLGYNYNDIQLYNPRVQARIGEAKRAIGIG